MSRSNALLPLLIVSLLCTKTRSQMPSLPLGFHWVDFKQEASTVSNIERALKDEHYTAIREIGLTDGFALVMTVWREPDQATFHGDEWQVYNISTKTWSVQTLLVGYNLEVKDWIKFESEGSQDLSVVYMDCWECEPASLFTAFHYDPRKGWSARWGNEKDESHPGIVIEVTDVGDPYTNEDVDQVFAVLAPDNGVATVGRWYYSKDLSTGKISETATKFWVDSSTGRDKSADFTGVQARTWETTLCKAPYSPYGLSRGQSSHACRRITSTKRKTSQ